MYESYCLWVLYAHSDLCERYIKIITKQYSKTYKCFLTDFCKKGRISLRLYFCDSCYLRTFDWVNPFWRFFFISKLVLPVWSHLNLVYFWQCYPWENYICVKFVFSMCATNGRITYHKSISMISFYGKGYISRVVWWEFG